MSDVKTRLELDKILERVASKAAFSLGKERVLNSEPSFSRLIVERELKRMRDAMQLVTEQGVLTFGGITDVSHPLDRSGKGAILSVEEIADVGRFIHGFMRLKKQYSNLDKTYEALDDLFESLVETPRLVQNISKAIGESGTVLDSASENLREIRQQISRTRHQIDRQTQSFLSKNKGTLVEDVVTLFHGRQAFLIKPGDKNKLEGTILGQSGSGQSLYFEPAFLSRLQNEYQSFLHQESEEIEKICMILSREIGSESTQLRANLETCAILDALFSKALWGVQNEGVVAEVTQDELHIVNARHPLIDKNEVIPNTYSLIPPHKMVLISGPNTGGKSVTLKTMGLFVLMTLSGLPILADEARVMMVDQIFVDIGDQQSIEKSLSSFSAHLETISHVIEHATSKSLVLLDELGSQTDPLEGESLSMAVLDHFREVGAWVVATTHFSRLKKYGTQYDDILISSVEFDLQDLKPTYRYREHVMGESNALAIAKRLGINLDIIEKAETYKKESTYEADHLLEILEKRIVETETLQEALTEEKRVLESEIETHHKEHQRLIDAVLEEKHTWIQARELEFEEKLNELQTKIKEMDKMVKPTERHRVLKEVEAMKPNTIVEPIHEQDLVKIKQSSQVGKVEKIEKDIAFVAVGALSLQVKLKDLVKMDAPKKVKKNTTRSHRGPSKSAIPLEINVIGKTVAEAVPMIEKYIDDCIVRNLSTCRIVHGVGTGTLRKAIHQSLSRNKHVQSYEIAAYNEGGAGATRVVLKS